MKVFVKTFGCKVNFCDSEKIKSELSNFGLDIVQSPENSDIIIINSCTVTAESDRKIRQFIHKIKKINPLTKMVLTGCFVHAFPEATSDIGVDYIFDSSKKSIIDIFKNIFNKKNNTLAPKPYSTNSSKTRAFLKIEEGCNNFCSYCIIPYARGRVCSKPVENVMIEAENFANLGFKEIVLVGINLSVYGTDINTNLCEIVEKISKISEIQRIRLGSLEPNFLTDENIERLLKIKKFCPQFHIALQSGSNKILSLMNRKYSREKYIEICKKINKICDKATITTDLMIGFPGEDKSDFSDSLDIIQKVNFLKVHVFPYSIRPKTKAATFKNQISKQVKSERVKKALDISEKISQIVKTSYIGKTFQVLYETTDNLGNYFGYTENYIRVKTFCEYNICGKILNVKIISVEKEFCTANIKH